MSMHRTEERGFTKRSYCPKVGSYFCENAFVSASIHFMMAMWCIFAVIEQMRFGRSAQQDHDYGNHPLGIYWEIPKVSSQYAMSPWFRGFYWQYTDADQLWNKWLDRGWAYALGGGLLYFWTKGWYMRHFGTKRCLEMIKRAKHSRRYYGRTVPTVPNPAVFVRNQMVLQAITRKMIRDGKAHNLHVQQALNSVK